MYKVINVDEKNITEKNEKLTGIFSKKSELIVL